MSESKNNIDNKLIEFQKPYLYRLKSNDKYNEDEEYRYRLLSNLLFTPYNQKDPEYLYFFGMLPCNFLPSAYIPLNYKNHLRNFNRLSKNDKFSEDNYKDIFNDNFNINDKKAIKEELKKYLISFESEHSLYNFNYVPLTINLIILWTIVIFMIMYISLYYYAELFNYVIAIILTILLVGSIIWKMIYTLQN
tara:strand:+ start:71 stop:646 length:576 start_codon:yes stop_codon:yes gene_type:complete